jgi:molecular chaperone DnaK (HSP70)
VRLGVDFGTTHTVVAYADRGNYPVLSFTDEAGDAHEWFPSVVAEADGELLCGFQALQGLQERGSALFSFKRLLSDPHAVPDSLVQIGALTLSFAELIARFLGALRRAVLTRSNLPDEHKRGELETVIGVPAHAHGAQRLITLDAFRAAGFSPIAMLNEPSAAGFEFTHRHRAVLNSRRDHVVVYDLGGGTFDASLVRIRETHHEVLATAGLGDLGGNDFDQVLYELVLTKAGLSAHALSPRAQLTLLLECRDAKERLSPSSRKLSFDLEAVLGKPGEVSIAVDDYYEACTPLVQRSLLSMAPVMRSFEGAMQMQAESSLASHVAGIYVVGGASCLPLVSRLLRKQFGRRVHRSPYPSAAVAIGLAIAADDGAGFEVSDRLSHTFGVFREGCAGQEVIFDPIFTPETSVPPRFGRRVSCRRVYRAAHNVGHYRFLECSAVSQDGRPFGDVVPTGDVLFPFDASLRENGLDLAKVPVERTQDGGPRIEEEYILDEHGMVAVTIRNLDADYQRVYRIGVSSAGV